jgi:hypothetical protein
MNASTAMAHRERAGLTLLASAVASHQFCCSSIDSVEVIAPPIDGLTHHISRITPGEGSFTHDVLVKVRS